MKQFESNKLILPRLLIVDDDEEIARNLAKILIYSDQEETQRLCRPTWVTRVDDFHHELTVEEPDVVSIDLKLDGSFDPDSPQSGYDLLSRVKSETEAAALIYSSQAFELDNNRSFELGADDYLNKPRSPKELRNAVRSLIIRKSALDHGDKSGVFEKIGPWMFIVGDRIIRNDSGTEKKLSISEYKFLELALTESNGVLDEETAYREIFEGKYTDDRRLPNLVYRLRKKLDADHLIISVRDDGYRLAL